MELGGGPSLPAVRVDLRAGLVSGAVGDEGLRLAVGERDDDEAGAGVMRPSSAARLGLLVQLRRSMPARRRKCRKLSAAVEVPVNPRPLVFTKTGASGATAARPAVRSRPGRVMAAAS
jgi:hypothetical protein